MRVRPAYRIFTARAAIRATVIRDIDACTIIISLAQRERTGTSVGEKAVLVLNARNKIIYKPGTPVRIRPGNSICGNRNAPSVWSVRKSRRLGPPASSRQYQDAKTSTLATHSAAAESSRVLGGSLCAGKREISYVSDQIIDAVTVKATTCPSIRFSRAPAGSIRDDCWEPEALKPPPVAASKVQN